MKKTVNTYENGKIVSTEVVDIPDETNIKDEIAAAKTIEELKEILTRVL